MDRLIATNSVNLAGADGPPVAGTPQYATDGNPGLSIPATRWPAYQYNAIQEEIMNVLIAAGITPSKANNAQLLAALTGGRLGRTRLTANTTFYVNAATGNNANSGLASGTPWLTLQYAYDFIAANYDLNGYIVTFSIVGNFTQGMDCSTVIPGARVSKDFDGAPNIIITTPSAASVAVSSANPCFLARSGNTLNISGAITLSGTASCTGGISAGGGGLVIFGGVTFGAFPSGAFHILAEAGGYVGAATSYNVTGGAACHLRAAHGGTIQLNIVTVTLTGTPAFGSAFANTGLCGVIDTSTGGGTATTFTGAATGPRYSASANGVIWTVGGGANYFPGNSAGATATGGQYN